MDAPRLQRMFDLVERLDGLPRLAAIVDRCEALEGVKASAGLDEDDLFPRVQVAAAVNLGPEGRATLPEVARRLEVVVDLVVAHGSTP